MRNYYNILEIDETANLAEIQSAYRRLAKLYHPDVNPHYMHATEMFKLVNEAYEVLSNTQKRIEYDSQFKRADRGTDYSTSKPADAAERSQTASANQNHYNHHWFPDGPDPFDDCQSFNAVNSFEEGKRVLLFIKTVYFLDICLGAFFIHHIGKIDLSIVPKVYFFCGWESWLLHLEVGIILGKISLLFSLFQLSLLQFDRISIFYSISKFLRVHEKYFHYIFAQAFLKILIAYNFISPMFGITMFKLSGMIFFFVILWNAFMGLFIFLNSMNVIGKSGAS